MKDRDDRQASGLGPLGIGAILFAACIAVILLVASRISLSGTSSHLSSASGVIRSIDSEKSLASIELTNHSPSEFPFRDDPVMFKVPEGYLGHEGFEIGCPVNVTYFYTLPPKEPLECCVIEIDADGQGDI